MPRAGWLTLVLLAVGSAAPAHAQPLAPLPPAGGPPLTATPVTSKRTAERSPSAPALPSVLGAPVGVGEVPVTPAGFVDAPADRKPQRAAVLGAPSAAGSSASFAPAPAAPVPAAVVDSAVSRTAYQPPNSDPVSEFLNRRSELKDREQSKSGGGLPKLDSSAKKIADWPDTLNGVVGHQNGGWFRSDHMFDGFISPVTNPFLFEDPRSLTEVRPIFIYQTVPSGQRDFGGGNISFFGTQGRVAFTDRWSLVFNKLGGIWTNPSSSKPFGDESGFAELWLGPKWTFYRGDENGILAAAGLQFQIPAGSGSVFQDTGTLSIVPYVSYAQNFFRDFKWGSMNLMASTGYSFSTNKERSDYYWLSAHVDFDIANLHRFYPLFELNWFLVSTDGNTRPIGAEGRDLINFGGQASGTGLLTGAFGGRVKITESAQVGVAFEFPFAGKKDFFQNRLTVDFILRY